MSDCANNGCGTVFKIDLATKNFTTLHTFSLAGNDGLSPLGGLTYDKAGLLYGTTSGGGSTGNGVIFAINPATSGFSVRHTFDRPVDGAHPRSDLTLRSGLFWGSTPSGGSGDYGTIFTYDPGSGVFANVHNQVLADGVAPYAAPVAGPKGLLYGTTTGGGRAGGGTVYSIKPKKFTYALVHDLVSPDGAIPMAGLVIDTKGSLYGVTSYGGGTIFKVTP